MSDLASFLEPRLEPLVQRWTQRISAVVVSGDVPEPVLRDHIKDVLRELVTTLRQGAVPDSIVHARRHGGQRYRVGFPVDALVREYGALRSLILDLIEEGNLAMTMADVRLLTDFIAQAIAEGVEEYDRHNQQALVEARLMTDAALTAGAVATFTWDIASDHVRGDESLARLFGVDLETAGALPLAHYLAVIHPDDRAETTARIEHTVRTHEPYEAEYRVVVEGRERWVVARGRVAPTSPGGPDRFSGVLVDITERKQAEQEREQLVEELTRSNDALDQFAHVASHDLRAPLRGIGNLASWIEEDLGDAVTDDARDKLAQMRGRVQHLDRMITSVLDFATAGRRKAMAEPIDVGRMLTEVIELLAPPPGLTISVDPAIPPLVAERAPLQQVLMNLLGNAVKYTQRPDAEIRVRAFEEGAFVHLTIADNGPGIAPADQERIWGLFQKASAPSKVEGTGIGLAVVKKLIESRGGKAWVESQLGQGATFHVLCPRRPSGAGADGSPSTAMP